jgi:hypothetical protein
VNKLMKAIIYEVWTKTSESLFTSIIIIIIIIRSLKEKEEIKKFDICFK